MSVEPMPRSRGRRPAISVESMVLIGALFLSSVANGPFWRSALAGRTLTEFATWRFAAAAFVLLVALHFLFIGLLATRRTVRPLLAVMILVSAAASHFIYRYGVVLDPSMLRNVLNTNPREAGELLGFDLAIVLALALAASALLWTFRLKRRPLRRALLVRGGALAVSAAVAAGALLTAFQDLSSLMRNRHELRYTITPGNVAASLWRVLARDARAATATRDAPDPAVRMIKTAAGRKPTLIVLVVGETARAANFSLNGYARQTNPELAKLDVINFPHATACGSSTEVSLPCMFSPFGRADYDEDRIRRHESVLHLLARAGLRVVWLDNQSGCKGVCDGLETKDLSRERIAEICDDHCFDEVLLHGLGGVIENATGDLVVVLHQLGNHGPAYFKRYPQDLKRFAPACESSALNECTREQIVNAYDNAILATDRFLARTIGFLDSQRARFDVALMYISDHGESLGERGLYLHGMPYAIAPREQLEVPMFWWVPADAALGLGVDLKCLRRKSIEPASHDNLFHSVLGLLTVQTPRYRSDRDLFDGCRGAGAQVAARPAVDIQ